MTFDPYAELGAIVTAFAQQSIAYAVCGAVSLAIHGHPRATKDLDLMKRLAGRPQDLADLHSLGESIDG